MISLSKNIVQIWKRKSLLIPLITVSRISMVWLELVLRYLQFLLATVQLILEFHIESFDICDAFLYYGFPIRADLTKFLNLFILRSDWPKPPTYQIKPQNHCFLFLKWCNFFWCWSQFAHRMGQSIQFF